MVTISVLGLTAVLLSQWERFAQVLFLCATRLFKKRQIQPQYRVMRAGVFVSLGLSGIIPMLHTIIKNGTEISFGEGQIHWLILMGQSLLRLRFMSNLF